MFHVFKKKIVYKKQKKHIIIKMVGFFSIIGIILFFVGVYHLTGIVVQQEKDIEIPKGHSIIQVSELLHEQGVIRSSLLFRIIAQYQDVSIKAGTYRFKETTPLLRVIDRVSSAEYGIEHISVTIPEGSTHNNIMDILRSKFLFSVDEISKILNVPEGYLFPDTYLFLPTDPIDNIIQVLQSNFEKKYEKASKNPVINISKDQAVIMASILEKEAGDNLEEKQIISGILWKRINEGMLLQVDAPFVYERKKGSAQLTHNDLQTDSRYNTYIRLGLTPTAIGNPGYDSLYAAYHPMESEYYFYLHSIEGNVYYAKTYDGHLKNIRMYLR